MTIRIIGFLVVFTILFGMSNADRLLFDGDNKTLIDTESRYRVKLLGTYILPGLFKFSFSIPKTEIRNDVFNNEKHIEWKYNFTKNETPPGSYRMYVEAWVYPFSNTMYGWKVAELTVPIEIRDTLDDFLSIDSRQDLPDITTDYIFSVNKTVNISAAIESGSPLARSTTKLNYHWWIEFNGTKINNSDSYDEKFQYIFNETGTYVVHLEVDAILEPNQLHVHGKTSKTIYIKKPIDSLKVDGNNFVENGSMMVLNFSCNGSPNFLFCHDFSMEKSNKSCFNSANRPLPDCQYMVSHYFPENGTRYVNVGIRNDVSTVFHNVKITIYKVGHQPSLVFVIIPLISLMMVAVITVVAITYYIRHRRRMNATIEVATTENFGIFDADDMDDANAGIEKTFCGRVKDSFSEILYRK